MRNKRIEYRGVFVTGECETVGKHITQECNKFIRTLLNDDICKDFIIPDLESLILGNISVAISGLGIDEHMTLLKEKSKTKSNF